MEYIVTKNHATKVQKNGKQSYPKNLTGNFTNFFGFIKSTIVIVQEPVFGQLHIHITMVDLMKPKKFVKLPVKFFG